MGLHFLPYERQRWQPYHTRTIGRRLGDYGRIEVSIDALMNTEERGVHETADCEKERDKCQTA